MSVDTFKLEASEDRSVFPFGLSSLLERARRESGVVPFRVPRHCSQGEIAAGQYSQTSYAFCCCAAGIDDEFCSLIAPREACLQQSITHRCRRTHIIPACRLHRLTVDSPRYATRRCAQRLSRGRLADGLNRSQWSVCANATRRCVQRLSLLACRLHRYTVDCLSKLNTQGVSRQVSVLRIER